MRSFQTSFILCDHKKQSFIIIMQQFRNKLVNIINQNRTDPITASNQLYDQLKDKFNQEELNYYNKIIQTFQGLSALNDYKDYMSSFKSTTYLTLSEALNQAAQSIAQEKGIQGKLDHESPAYIFEKISANSKVKGKIGELISLKAHSSQQISTYFFIDDGLATRKRRRMLLDANYKYIGIGTAQHKTQEIITVILLAENVLEVSSASLAKFSSEQQRLLMASDY